MVPVGAAGLVLPTGLRVPPGLRPRSSGCRRWCALRPSGPGGHYDGRAQREEWHGVGMAR